MRKAAAKVRISEQKTKEIGNFLCFFRTRVLSKRSFKGTKKRENKKIKE